MEFDRRFLIDYCSCTMKNGQYNYVMYYMNGVFYLERSLQRPPAMPTIKIIDYNRSVAEIRKLFTDTIKNHQQSSDFVSFVPRYTWVQSFPWIEHTRSCEVIVTYHFEDYQIEYNQHKLTFAFDQWGYCYGVDIDQSFFVDYEGFDLWIRTGKYYFENKLNPQVYRETFVDKIYQTFKWLYYRSDKKDLMKHIRSYGRFDTPTHGFEMIGYDDNCLFEFLMDLACDQKINASLQQVYLNVVWTMTRAELLEKSKALKLEKINKEKNGKNVSQFSKD